MLISSNQLACWLSEASVEAARQRATIEVITDGFVVRSTRSGDHQRIMVTFDEVLLANANVLLLAVERYAEGVS